MRIFRHACLLVVAMLAVTSSAFASDDDKFPVQFTVKAASFDSSGCYMSLVNNDIEYSVRSGAILHACPVFRPGTILNGRFHDDKHIQIMFTGKDGKNKVQNYEVRETTFFAQG